MTENHENREEIKIEHASPKDCPDLVAIDQDRAEQRFQEEKIPLPEERTFEEKLKKWEKRLQDERQTIIVAKVAGRSVGYIQMYPEGNGVVHIDTLSVLRPYQGKGPARDLVDVAEAEAKLSLEAKKIELFTHEKNSAAVIFWRDKRKYKQEGEPIPVTNERYKDAWPYQLKMVKHLDAEGKID